MRKERKAESLIVQPVCIAPDHVLRHILDECFRAMLISYSKECGGAWESDAAESFTQSFFPLLPSYSTST